MLNKLNIESFYAIKITAFDFNIDEAKRVLGIIANKSKDKMHMQFGDFSIDDLLIYDDSNNFSFISENNKYIGLFFFNATAKKTIFINNLSDGWMTLSNNISSISNSDFYSFKFSDLNSNDAMNLLKYNSPSKNKERVVYIMKDQRWVFYEEGEQEWFEDTNNYKKRIIKQRLSNNILLSYCYKLNLKVDGADFFYPNEECILFEYTWKIK